MSISLYWLQCGACGGDTMSLLSNESPDVTELFAGLDLEPLWHLSLSGISPKEPVAPDGARGDRGGESGEDA